MRRGLVVALLVVSLAAGVAVGVVASKPYPRWTLTDYQEIPFGHCPPGQLCGVPEVLRVGVMYDYLTGAQVVVIPGVGVAVIGHGHLTARVRVP